MDAVSCLKYDDNLNMRRCWRLSLHITNDLLPYRCCRCSFKQVMGGNVNTRRMSKPDMGSIFHIKNQWNILVTGNYYVNYKNYQILMLLTSSDTKRTIMHQFLFTNSASKNWFQYVRGVYATAINFPCIITLVLSNPPLRRGDCQILNTLFGRDRIRYPWYLFSN